MGNSTPENTNIEKQQVDIWDYVQILLKNRGMIFRNCLVILVLSVIISFVIPRKYKATAKLLPPEQSSSVNSFGGLSPEIVSNLSILNFNTTTELFVQILLSRSVQQAVLEQEYQYGDKKETLVAYFGAENIELALEDLNKVTSINALPEGIINISVELGDAELAAAVSNAYVAELDSVNQEKSTSQAKNSRVYIENQLNLTKSRLLQADQELANFMQNQKAISLEHQIRTAIEEVGALKGRIIAKEVELAMKSQALRANHKEIIAIRTEITELKKQYDKLQYGAQTHSAEEEREFYIPMIDVPDVSRQLAEYLRAVKVQETVFELLNQQYYQAKIQEAKDTPTVQVLDKATPPIYPSKPRRALIVILAVGMVFFMSVFGAFFAKYMERVNKVEANREKLNSIKTALANDWQKFKGKISRKS